MKVCGPARGQQNRRSLQSISASRGILPKRCRTATLFRQDQHHKISVKNYVSYTVGSWLHHWVRCFIRPLIASNESRRSPPFYESESQRDEPRSIGSERGVNTTGKELRGDSSRKSGGVTP